ncbi:MAG: Trk family potassium uptake protein [Clostridia bacterium]|nr:Trk family potassium uptake protein [Clostridia bacterium]
MNLEQTSKRFITADRRDSYGATVRRRKSPAQVLALGFITIILVGTLLLMLPISSNNGKLTEWSTALFTATSATCVTGLTVVDTLGHWSIFGQTVILCMIQVGGLGFMSVAVLMSKILRRTVTPRENRLVTEALGLSSAQDASSGFMRRILIGTFVVEGMGAALLAIRFVPIFGWRSGIFKSVFHSVSAFCNAGFDILGNYGGGFSMTAFTDDPLVMSVLSFLVIFGGIGFVVWSDLFDWVACRIESFFRRMREWRGYRWEKSIRSTSAADITGRRDRLGVYAKFILLLSLILFLAGFVLTLLLEWNGVLADMPISQKLWAAFFHSVSLRTAGFSAFDNASMTGAGKGVSILLMLIGGASGSTAGGIKVGTVGILIWSVFQIARGKDQIVLMRRTISKDTVLRAMTITLIGLCCAFGSALLLSAGCGTGLMEALYETASAYATVGLSLNLSPTLNLFGRCLVILLMYMGRVGILTVIYSLALHHANQSTGARYPETEFPVG